MVSVLVTLVGHCTSESARIFCCTEDVPGGAVARLAWRSGVAHGVLDLELTPAAPYAVGVFDLTGLPAGGRVEYAVVAARTGEPLPTADEIAAMGAGRVFRLLPVGRSPRIALLSCNGFTEVPEPGRRLAMWPRLALAIESGEVDLVIHAGDQVYADKLVAEHQGDGYEALLDGYRRLYVAAWSEPEIAKVLTSVPNIMMWDDHDICDGWGSNDNDQLPERAPVFAAARQAFAEFQASHNPPALGPGSFGCATDHHELAVALLDMRSHRSYPEGRILGAEQRDQLAHWLAGLSPVVRRVFLVIGTPLVHSNILRVAQVPRWMRVYDDLGSDFRDAWVAPNNQAECAALVETCTAFLRSRPGVDVTVLAGDVHVGTVGCIDTADDGPSIWQITSSGISTPPPDVVSSWVLKRVTKQVVDLGAGASGQLLPVMPDEQDLLMRRNFAILVHDEADHRLDVRYITEGFEQPLQFVLPSRSAKDGAG